MSKVWRTHLGVQYLTRKNRFPGRDFLIVNMPKWFLPAPSAPLTLTTSFHFDIHINPAEDTGIDRIIYERGMYEMGTMHFIQENLSAGDTFLDAGANIGVMSLVAATKVGSTGRVLAFEPHPKTRAILEKNKGLNGFDQIDIQALGLGSGKSKGTLFNENKNRGGASLMGYAENDVHGAEIQIVSLDEITDQLKLDKLDLVKIDIEGWEFEMLRGAEATLVRFRPTIIVEIDLQRKLEGGTVREMVDYLVDLGYDVFRFPENKNHPGELVRVRDLGELPEHDNLVFRPNKKK
jgi:FkbM family methyltransferase